MKVLIIDDDVDSLAIAKFRLKKDGYILESAGDGIEGLARAREVDPDLILLDVQMPGKSGFEVCEELKSDSDLCNIPVIFLSAADDISEKVKGLDLGAVDYVTKPFDIFELRARVRAALRTKRLQDLLLQYGEVDSLTEIYNRRVLMERLQQEWDRLLRSNAVFSFIMTDIDKFKNVNDTYGHPVGDDVLEKVAYTLKKSIRSGDIVGRYGGEEFGIIMANSTAQEAFVAADRYRQLIEKIVFRAKKKSFSVTASFGVADSSGKDSLDELVSAADSAMYEAKENGRNRVCISD
ncbi:MAG: diguanylate cyclase [Candidatus Fermentibacteria bacterium]|nr:diguanylate cyclase [Candidatus Fermentibacteria bacterium]